MTFKKGDPVMVVKPSLCCGGMDDIGRVFVVAAVESGEGWECAGCGDEGDGLVQALENEDSAYDTRCLIKLDHPGVEDCLEVDHALSDRVS